jgi:hypothetical protein
MKQLNGQGEPFFMIFPWGKVAGMLFLLVFGVMLVYRLSEAGGPHIKQACLLAIPVSLTAGLLGLYAIGKTWRRDIHWILIGVMLACVIRLLIGGAGVAIIAFFTNVQRSWFVLFLGIYYTAFLVVDTWVALWVLRNSKIKLEDQEIVHGNFWDIIG